MKPLLLLMATILLSVTSCSRGADAAKYNNKIINEQEKVIKMIEKVGDTVGSSAEARRKELTAAISASLNEIKSMPAFHGSSTFRDKAVRLFEQYLEVFDKQYKQVLESRAAGEDSEAAINAAKAFTDKLAEVETNYETPLIAEQRKFAADNNVTLKPGN
jgi:hypothetical protein